MLRRNVWIALASVLLGSVGASFALTSGGGNVAQAAQCACCAVSGCTGEDCTCVCEECDENCTNCAVCCGDCPACGPLLTGATSVVEPASCVEACCNAK